MKDSTAEFFDRLGRGRHEMLPEKVSATIRFDLKHGDQTDHWFIAIDAGLIRVSREDRPADCVAQTEKCLFDRIATGEANIISALIRDEFGLEGKKGLIGVIRKLLPGPPGGHNSRVSGR
jgi:putative sterol carrier protein